LIPAIRPEIIKEIELHRTHGAEIAILSSALSDICEGIGSYLEVDTVISTHMEFENGILTGKTNGGFCFEEQKRIELDKYCSKKKYNTDEAYYYGDSISDLPPLQSAGNPVCVDPDKRLKRIANKRSWRILDLNSI